MLQTCAAVALMNGTAGAGSPDASVIQAELLPGWQTERGTQMAGLRLTLAPGWKTYWRAPGDAGIPPSFDWTGSRNMQAVATHWPRPEVFEQNGMRTIGYQDQVVLPLELTPRKAGEPISLRGHINLGVCEDICMPMTLDIQADLPAESHPAPIRAALKDRPMTARQAGVGDVTCSVEPTSDGLRLTTHITMPRIGGDEMAVIELPDPTVWVAEAETTRRGNQLVAVTDLVPDGGALALNRSNVRITVLAGNQAVDIRGCDGR